MRSSRRISLSFLASAQASLKPQPANRESSLPLLDNRQNNRRKTGKGEGGGVGLSTSWQKTQAKINLTDMQSLVMEGILRGFSRRIDMHFP
jgi:hypothetical protein